MEKSYKYRLYPNKKQKEMLSKTFGCTRFIYNYYLNKKIELYKNEKQNMTRFQCDKDMTSLKQEKMVYLLPFISRKFRSYS